jgi:hypothetical protein
MAPLPAVSNPFKTCDRCSVYHGSYPCPRMNEPLYVPDYESAKKEQKERTNQLSEEFGLEDSGTQEPQTEASSISFWARIKNFIKNILDSIFTDTEETPTVQVRPVLYSRKYWDRSTRRTIYIK